MMSDLQMYLQAMYKEQCDQARQHENMRQQSTNLILTLSAALAATAGAALSATVKPLLDARVPWVVGLFSILGLFVFPCASLGEALSLKHYERNRLHVARAAQYRRKLEALFSGVGLETISKSADEKHRESWDRNALNPGIITARLHERWIAIYRFVRYLGFALSAIPLCLAIVLTIMMYNSH